MNTGSSASNYLEAPVDLHAETDNWLNEHRDQRVSSTTKSQTVEPENSLSDSITSINMAGEIQKLSAGDNSDNSDNPMSSDEWKEEETKENESQASGNDGNADVNEEDQMEADASDQPSQHEQVNIQSETKEKESHESADSIQSEASSKQPEAFSDPNQQAKSSPLPPSASPSAQSIPRVETVDSIDSVDLFRTETNSNAEVIDDIKLSESAVASGDAEHDEEQTAEEMTPLNQKAGTKEVEHEPRSSFAAAAANGIMSVLSNLSGSPRGSPRTTPRQSPQPSPRGSTSSQGGSDPASSETPSLAARAAAAAAAATGMTPRASSPTQEIPEISEARTWPDENHEGDDTKEQASRPSPPKSDVGVGGRLTPFKFPKLALPKSSPLASKADQEEEFSPLLSPTADDDVEPGDNAEGDNEEARVLSVVPTVVVSDDFEDKQDDLEEDGADPETPTEQDSGDELKEDDEDSPSRCQRVLAFLKTRKGIAVVCFFLLLVIGIGVGVGLASQEELSYCDAARRGYSIPNEEQYTQLDFNWLFDVSVTDKWQRSFLMDMNRDFQAVVIPAMAGCTGNITADKSRIINGYAVSARDTGDCNSGAARPCFRLLFDFAVWVREDYVNPYEMITYLNNNFGAFVTDQIQSKDIVRSAQPVALEYI